MLMPRLSISGKRPFAGKTERASQPRHGAEHNGCASFCEQLKFVFVDMYDMG